MMNRDLTEPGITHSTLPLASLKRRFPAFDFMRTIGILFIILLHCLAPTDNKTFFHVSVYFISSGLLACFFTLSGSLLLPVAESMTAFYKRRLIRILLPTLIWSYIYLLVSWHFGDLNFAAFKYKLGIVPFNYIATYFWFAYTIVGMYLFMPIISPWLEKATKNDIEIALGLFVVAYGIPYYQFHVGHIEPTYSLFSLFFNCIGYSVLGFYLARWNIDRHANRFFLCVLAIIGVALPVVGAFRYDFNLFVDKGFMVTPNSLEMVSCIILFSIIWKAYGAMKQPESYSTTVASWFDRAIKSISKASFGMYLNHVIIIQFILPEYLGLTNENQIALALATALCSYILSAACMRLPFIGKYLG